MSLKMIHVLVIFLSAALAAGFGKWGLTHYFYVGVLSLALAVALAVYLVWFIRKIL